MPPITTVTPATATPTQATPPGGDLRLAYRERGFVKGTEQVDVRACRERVAALQDGQGAGSIRWWGRSEGKSACTLTKLPQLAERDEAFLRLAQDPRIVSVVEGLIGPALIFRDVLIAKPEASGAPIYFHQDASYWDVDRPDLVLSAWIALDDAPAESGALQVYTGTHDRVREHDLILGGVCVPRPLTRLLRTAVSFTGTGDNPRTLREQWLAAARQGVMERATRAWPRLADLNQLQLSPSSLDSSRLLTLPAQAGEVIFFHSLLVHGSGPNLSPRPRRAYIVTYMGTECTVRGRLPTRYLPARPV